MRFLLDQAIAHGAGKVEEAQVARYWDGRPGLSLSGPEAVHPVTSADLAPGCLEMALHSLLLALALQEPLGRADPSAGGPTLRTNAVWMTRTRTESSPGPGSRPRRSCPAGVSDRDPRQGRTTAGAGRIRVSRMTSCACMASGRSRRIVAGSSAVICAGGSSEGPGAIPGGLHPQVPGGSPGGKSADWGPEWGSGTDIPKVPRTILNG